MTPFRAKDRKVWKMRVTDEHGDSGIFSCGTDDLATARQVANAVKSLRRRRIWEPLNAVVRGDVTLGRMFDAYESGTLDTLLKELNDPDLSALVSEWPTNDAYRMQVRRMIPEGERYPASRFTRKAVSEFLANLNQSPRRENEPVRAMSGSTKNRYRAALSVFARWLVEREVLESNPVRDVRQHTPNDPRSVWLSRDDAKRLIDRLPGEMAAIEALMAATGMELQAAQRLRVRDVSLEMRTAKARGTKTRWRDRVVIGTELWAWKRFANWFEAVMTPWDHERDILVFSVRGDTLLKTHQRLSAELGIPRTTLHDWRHSYAVWSLKDGLDREAIAQQLGHKDPSLLDTLYGRYKPEPLDFVAKKSTPVPKRRRK